MPECTVDAQKRRACAVRDALVGLRVRVRGQSGAIVSVEKDNRHARVAFVDSAGSDSTALVPVEGIVPCRENTLGGASEPAGGLVRTTTARGVEETARRACLLATTPYLWVALSKKTCPVRPMWYVSPGFFFYDDF